MAFPSVRTNATTDITTAATSHTINLPSGYTNGSFNGETIVLLMRVTVGGAVTLPANWSKPVDVSTDGADDQFIIAYKKADGFEGASFSITTASAKVAAITLAIQGAADPTVRSPELSTIATGASTSPDPTTCTPTGGAKDYLWLWLGGWEGEQTSPPTGDPATGYSGRLGASTGTAGAVTTNCRVALSTKQANAASEDGGIWTISVSDDWSAFVMAIHPALTLVGVDQEELIPAPTWDIDRNAVIAL